MQNLLWHLSPLVLTLTCDNGKEFAGHRQTAEALDTDLFSVRPYRSCERGLNEHTNGLLRHFVPKTENLRTLDPQRGPSPTHFLLSSWRAQPASALVVRPPFRARFRCHPRVTATSGASP